MPLELPPLQIEPGLVPGGLVFKSVVDGLCVEEVRLNGDSLDIDVAAVAERQRDQLGQAHSAGQSACVLVYDGDNGRLVHRLHFEPEAQLPEGFATWSLEEAAAYYLND